jgi:hypothetical protein
VDINKLGIDKESVVYLLNFIMDNLKEDRSIALRHHDTLSAILDGDAGEGRSDIEVQLLMNDVSEALKRFLDTSAGSIDQAIKITKIVSDLYSKEDKDEYLSEDDRSEIESLAGELRQDRNNVYDINGDKNGTES